MSTLGVELTVYTQAATVTSSLTLIPQLGDEGIANSKETLQRLDSSKFA